MLCGGSINNAVLAFTDFCSAGDYGLHSQDNGGKEMRFAFV